ncbi:MAG: SPOR domain-containing protein, partial [Alphaproteobacteria bacterium]|nr:SPOR domain-containing protein [Alphaproteobacteria bacterium]
RAPGGGGAFGVQIGSFRERSHAVEAWPAKQREYGGLLQGLTPAVVETTVPGKGRWFRLYAAGLGRDAADRLCGAIKQRGDFCAIATL